MSGTVALSWGPSGGFYVTRHRVCLGRVALTCIPRIEVDDLIRAYANCSPGSRSDPNQDG